MAMKHIRQAIRMLAEMNQDEIVKYYWQIADRRAEAHSWEERERLRLLLVAIDAIGELKFSNWRMSRQEAA